MGAIISAPQEYRRIAEEIEQKCQKKREKEARLKIVKECIGKECPGFKNRLNEMEILSASNKIKFPCSLEELFKLTCEERVRNQLETFVAFGQRGLADFQKLKEEISKANGFIPPELQDTPRSPPAPHPRTPTPVPWTPTPRSDSSTSSSTPKTPNTVRETGK